MELRTYLERIGYRGPAEPTFACLSGIHRCQALAVPYENLDIQLGRFVDRDRHRIFEKIVSTRRGGWCYEVHELLLWALQTIGFEAELVTAGVHRREFGDEKLGNHTAILVRLSQTYLADLGLGDGIRDPLPLEEGAHTQGALVYNLQQIEGGFWRFENHQFAYPTSFDFLDTPADLNLIDRKAKELQTNPDSVLLQNLVCQKMQLNSVTCLTGRILRHKTISGTAKRLVNRSEFLDVLFETFGILEPAALSIWPKIEARHTELFGAKPIAEISVDGF